MLYNNIENSMSGYEGDTDLGSRRARNEEEIAARKEEIPNIAAELIMLEDYDNITIGTISQKTGHLLKPV